MKAYVTFLTDNYLPGVVALSNSIRKHSKYPLFAMYHALSKESMDVLKDMGVVPIKIDRVNCKNESKKYTNTYSKLAAFGLTQFDKIIFMDADTLMLKNMDCLFNIKQPFAAAPDHGIKLREHIFNSGMMVITPSKYVFDKMLKSVDVLPSYDGGDQGFLNSFFEGKWHKLDHRFNVLKRIYVHHKRLWNKLDTHSIHFVDIKPWAPDGGDPAYAKLNELWRVYYNMKLPKMERFNEHFPEAYCVNLDSRPDKWKATAEEFKKFGIKASRFPAIKGNPDKIDTKLSDGEVGCILSHVKILETAKAKGWHTVMIFEDDVVFHDNFTQRFNKAMAMLPDDWDMFYLGGDYGHAKFMNPIGGEVYRAGAVLHTHSYAVHIRAYNKLINALLDFSHAADQRFKRLHPTIKTYCVYPNLTWQRDGWSDVQERMTAYDWINPNKNDMNDFKGKYAKFNKHIKNIIK